MQPRRCVRTVWLVALGLGVVISAIMVVVLVSSSSLDVVFTGREAAFGEMDRVRARFAERVPCLERGASEVPQGIADGGSEPRAVHMLAWEREDNRLVRVSTPYWVLRVAGVKMNAARLMAPPLEHITVADLDRCGRGVVVDRRTAGGGRLLIWAE